MNIGNNIRSIRKEKKMTLQQIGDAMGCSPQLISQYENGKRTPKIETIQKIADALNVSINDLMPDSYDRTIQTGYELSATDYSAIEAMANHKIFTDKERKKIFEKIEHYRNILVKMNDRDRILEYSEKTHTELENILFKMLTNKPGFDVSNAIIVLSCFLSLKDKDQFSIIEMLLEYSYPNKDLKYWGILSNTPPQE